MRITVLGSGTSTGVPVIGCECAVCRSDAPENKRLRCSLYIEDNGSAFLVDCSTDFRQQALRYGIRRIDAVLFTHNHADHMNGIDDLRVFNYLQGSAIGVYGDKVTLETIRRRFDYCFNPPQVGGGFPHLRLQEVQPRKGIRLGELDILPVRLKHGILDILGYRIGDSFAYLTDCSAVPEESMAQLEGVEVLIVDALRHKPHSTHFSLEQALELSRSLRPAQTWFTHIADDLDHFETNARLPANAQLLRDGQVIELPCRPGHHTSHRKAGALI